MSEAAAPPPPPSRFNRVCCLEDWNDPARRAAIRAISTDLVKNAPNYPDGEEHRKHWEFAQLLTGLETFGVLRPDASMISVAAGCERALFYLTNHIRWVFATDIYGMGDFKDVDATPKMLLTPEEFSPIPMNRNHLIVQWMSALELMHDDNTFDAAFSLSSIEHFGGVEGAVKSLREMCRVVKPGGIVMTATECVVNGAGRMEAHDLTLFAPEDVAEMTAAVPGLELVEPVDFTVTPATLETVIPLEDAVREGLAGKSRYPHVVLQLGPFQFTSLTLFWRKPLPPAPPPPPQPWYKRLMGRGA